MKEDRYLGKMLSKDVHDFILRKKINKDAERIGYDEIEFRNVFSTQFTKLNTKNSLKSGHKIKKVVPKNGKSIVFNMVYCEEGRFTMGSDNKDHNNPKRVVEIEKPFLLGEAEVTQELYELVMDNNPSHFQGYKYANSSQTPVECVTWYEAIMFCNKLSELLGINSYYETKVEYHDNSKSIKNASVEINEKANGFRLPLEKEWEYAAKASTNNQWSGTNNKSNLGEYAWFGEDEYSGSTHPISQKKPNEWGFYDMSGNICEWCWDVEDSKSNSRVVRGGSWYNYAPSLHSTSRSCISPTRKYNDLGFRIAASL